jgi:hypothetical protein
MNWTGEEEESVGAASTDYLVFPIPERSCKRVKQCTAENIEGRIQESVDAETS